ncbi:MAG TPA: fatty acid desaturase family protein [Drouetiella sp.]|jgi:fatty acid desaturase
MTVDANYAGTDTINRFVKSAKPILARGLVDLLVWSWGMLILGLAVYVLFPNVLTFAFAFLVVTSRMGALLAIAHDAHHGTFLPNRKWNDLVAAWFCAYPVGSIYSSSRAVHMAHHKLLNTPEDPDRNFHFEDNKSTPQQFAWHFLRLVFGGQLWTSIVVNGILRPIQKDAAPTQNKPAPVVVLTRKGHPEILNLVPVQLVIWGALWAVSGQWWLYLAVWLGPIFTLGTFLGFLRGFVDHARLPDDNAVNSSERLVTVLNANFLERAFLAPYDFKYHAEHHMFPSVPHYHLHELHTILQADENYRHRYLMRPSYTAFIKEYWSQISRNAQQGSNAPAAPAAAHPSVQK